MTFPTAAAIRTARSICSGEMSLRDSIDSRAGAAQSTRDDNTKPEQMERMTRTMSGAAQVGRCAIDLNVSSGENRTPKMRAKEFGFGAAAGAGAIGGASVVIFSPQTELTFRISANCIGRRRKKMGNAALPLSPLPL